MLEAHKDDLIEAAAKMADDFLNESISVDAMRERAQDFKRLLALHMTSG